jgi:hypothetical protein
MGQRSRPNSSVMLKAKRVCRCHQREMTRHGPSSISRLMDRSRSNSTVQPPRKPTLAYNNGSNPNGRDTTSGRRPDDGNGVASADHRYTHTDQSQSLRLSRPASAARCGPIRIAPTAAIGFSARASCARPAPRCLAGRTSAPVRGSAATSYHRGPLACRDRNQDRDRNCLSLGSAGEGNGKRISKGALSFSQNQVPPSHCATPRIRGSRRLWCHLLSTIAAPDL